MMKNLFIHLTRYFSLDRAKEERENAVPDLQYLERNEVSQLNSPLHTFQDVLYN